MDVDLWNSPQSCMTTDRMTWKVISLIMRYQAGLSSFKTWHLKIHLLLLRTGLTCTGYCIWHISRADVLDNMLAAIQAKNKVYSFVSSISESHNWKSFFLSGNLLQMLCKLPINFMPTVQQNSLMKKWGGVGNRHPDYRTSFHFSRIFCSQFAFDLVTLWMTRQIRRMFRYLKNCISLY